LAKPILAFPAEFVDFLEAVPVDVAWPIYGVDVSLVERAFLDVVGPPHGVDVRPEAVRQLDVTP
jgi:hypothetical protein